MSKEVRVLWEIDCFKVLPIAKCRAVNRRPHSIPYRKHVIKKYSPPIARSLNDCKGHVFFPIKKYIFLYKVIIEVIIFYYNL